MNLDLDAESRLRETRVNYGVVLDSGGLPVAHLLPLLLLPGAKERLRAVQGVLHSLECGDGREE